jgi:hypothetical protein
MGGAQQFKQANLFLCKTLHAQGLLPNATD